ncbi:unnamed protein product, partial [Prorocentrum cordatum]
RTWPLCWWLTRPATNASSASGRLQATSGGRAETPALRPPMRRRGANHLPQPYHREGDEEREREREREERERERESAETFCELSKSAKKTLCLLRNAEEEVVKR